MRKKFFICCFTLLTPGCLTEAPAPPPVSPAVSGIPVVTERFITIERIQDFVRIRLKKVDRPFLLPAEIEQIKKELRELSAEERELLRQLIEHLYEQPRPPIPRVLT